MRPGDPRLEGQSVARDRLKAAQVSSEREGTGELVVGHRPQQDLRGNDAPRYLSRRAPREPALPDADGGGGAGAVDGRGGVLGCQVNPVLLRVTYSSLLLISSLQHFCVTGR